MTLRVGDALRLTAAPQGATDGLVEIEIGDDAPLQTSVGDPVQHTFISPGTVTVEGVHTAADGTQHTGELQVTVVDGAFPAEPPACMLGRTRIWNPGDWSESAVFDTDATVRAARLDDGRLSLTMKNVADAHRILARAGDRGPVVDGTPLDGFCLEALADGYVWVMERYDDGSERWRQEVFERNLPPSVDIRIHVFIGGATLDDLTRERWIAHPDFSDIGVHAFDMLRSPDATHSTCHRIQTYQNGVPLGEAYYHQKLLPDEEQL